MNLLDIIIGGILIIGFVLGFKDGIIRKIIGIIGFVFATFVSIRLAPSLGNMIERLFGIEFYLAQLIGGASMFIAIMIVTAIIKRIVHPFDKVNNVINQILGGAVGICQMLIFLSALFLLLNIFSFPSGSLKKDSYLHEKVMKIIPSVIRYVQNYTPDTKKVLKDYINDKDNDTTK